MLRIKLAIAALTALALLPLTASAAASYKVSAQVSRNGAPIASPTLTVKPGAPASVAIPGENGYVLEVTVTESGQDMIELAADLKTNHGSVSSTVTTKPGKAVKISTGDIDFGVTAEALED